MPQLPRPPEVSTPDLPVSIILLIAVVVLFFVFAFTNKKHPSMERMQNVPPRHDVPIGYARCSQSPVRGVMKDVFADSNVVRRGSGSGSGSGSWQLYYPCTFTHVEKELRQARMRNKIIYAVDGCDIIASKNGVWRLLLDAYGRRESARLMPNTFLSSDADELRAFLAGYSPRHMYICKKNVQRKQGLLLTNNLDELLQCQYRGYKVIQRYFQDVFVIGGRKLNLRIYVLVVCDVDGTKRAYVHRNGMCLYTNRPYSKRDVHRTETQITSLNMDPAVYDALPLDFVDLRRALFEGHAALPGQYAAGGVRFESAVFGAMCGKVGRIMDAALPAMCSQAHLRSNVRFQLFGGDVILTEGLEPFVLEFNKGPEMKPMNDRDYRLKRCVLEDAMRLGGALPMQSIERVHGFVEVSRTVQ
jgi:hypothetical protein